MKYLLIATVAFALSGCESIEPRDYIAMAANDCSAMGYQPGSQAHATCTQQVYQQGEASRASASAHFSQSLIDTGMTLM
jgi:hypothetical protein